MAMFGFTYNTAAPLCRVGVELRHGIFDIMNVNTCARQTKNRPSESSRAPPLCQLENTPT